MKGKTPPSRRAMALRPAAVRPAAISSSPTARSISRRSSEPNILVCLTQEAYNSYSSIIRPGGLLLTDSRYVQLTRKVDAKQIEMPMYDRVMEKIGKPVVFNICVLGALIGITEVVEPRAVMATITDRVPKDFVDLNNRAFDLGLALGAQYNW